MKNVILDSSSAILIYRSGMFSAMFEFSKIIISHEVYRELTIRGYDGAELFDDLCTSGAIKVFNTSGEKIVTRSNALHKGERETIALFYEGRGDYLITDDGKAGAFCRDNSIPYINALLAVKILFMKNIITEPDYTAAWRWLIQNGRYSGKVITWAENADKQNLAVFL